MDNLCHTLLAATLAKAGLERSTRRAHATLVIGANLPDADIFIAPFLGPGGYLVHHRGITHSFVGIAVLTPLVALAVYLYSRWRDPPGSRARPGPLVLVSAVGLLSHLLLDWTNPYGVRPWLPFEDRWIYGDWIAIVDPWLWLTFGASLYWLTGRGLRRQLAWGLLALALSSAVVLSDRAHEWMRVVWFAGLGLAFLGGRLEVFRRGAMAWAALGFVVAYWGFAAVAHDRALQVVGHAASPSSREVAAIPTPGNPLTWRIVEYGPDSVRVMLLQLARREELPRLLGAFATGLETPIARAALETEGGRAMRAFARFPYAEVDARARPPIVYIRDARYALTERTGWGVLPIAIASERAPTEGSE